MKTALDIMKKEVVSVKPDTPLIEAINLMLKNDLSGLPVVDNGQLVGLLTNYDMIIRGTSIHLPTFIKLFHRIEINRKDAEPVKEELKKLASLKVSEAMHSNPKFVTDVDSVFEVIDTFSKDVTSPLPVIDGQKALVGVIGRHDIVKFMGEQKIDAHLFEEQLRLENIFNDFLNVFDKRYILVSKARARSWLIVSTLSIAVGFSIAFALILRINK